MNTNTLTILRILGLSAGFTPLAAYSQDDDELPTIQPVTFALTETYEAPGLAAKDEEGKIIKGADPVWEQEYTVDSYKGEDITKSVSTYEYASKMLTYKISNKEILTDLVNEGVIDTIVGYSISFRDGDMEGFFLTKKGMEPIDISDYLSVDSEGPDVASDSGKEVYTSDYVKETETVAKTGKGSGKLLVNISYETSEVSVGVQGVATWSDNLKSFGKGEDQFFAWIPSPGRVSSIAGYLVEGGDGEEGIDDFEDSSLIEGTITLGAGSLLNPVL